MKKSSLLFLFIMLFSLAAMVGIIWSSYLHHEATMVQEVPFIPDSVPTTHSDTINAVMP